MTVALMPSQYGQSIEALYSFSKKNIKKKETTSIQHGPWGLTEQLGYKQVINGYHVLSAERYHAETLVMGSPHGFFILSLHMKIHMTHRFPTHPPVIKHSNYCRCSLYFLEGLKGKASTV
jgi:hypothetical protein